MYAYHPHVRTTLIQAMDEACNDLNPDLQYQSKLWTHHLIQGFFWICTIFYNVE